MNGEEEDLIKRNDGGRRERIRPRVRASSLIPPGLILSLFLVSSLIPHPSSLHSIEIPLEGLGKITNIAYVNMHKIFEAFPETEKARVELNRIIEEKKADITDKKETIAHLKAEVDFLRRQMAAVTPSTAAARTQVIESTDTVTFTNQEASTWTPGGLTVLTLPENSPLKFIFSPPDPSAAVEEGQGTVRYSTFNAEAPQALPGIPSPAPQLSDKEAQLTQMEADLQVFVGQAEEEVRNLEEGRTMTLMAKIYKAVQDVAAKEGYQVIVDRDSILYGDNAVDITETVIYKLNAPKFGR